VSNRAASEGSLRAEWRGLEEGGANFPGRVCGRSDPGRGGTIIWRQRGALDCSLQKSPFTTEGGGAEGPSHKESKFERKEVWQPWGLKEGPSIEGDPGADGLEERAFRRAKGRRGSGQSQKNLLVRGRRGESTVLPILREEMGLGGAAVVRRKSVWHETGRG